MTLYKAQFNWFGELHTFYRYYSTLRQAKRQFFTLLGERVGYSLHRIRTHYAYTNSQAYLIKEVK